jgi:hypothetical protein
MNFYETNIGTIEPLILTALSANTISNICYSSLYPQDIIYYDYSDNEYLQDDNTNNGLRKGWIYKRIDTILNIKIPYDFRNIKYGDKGVYGDIINIDYSIDIDRTKNIDWEIENKSFLGNNKNKIASYFINNIIRCHSFSNNYIYSMNNNNITDSIFDNNNIDEFNSNDISNFRLINSDLTDATYIQDSNIKCHFNTHRDRGYYIDYSGVNIINIID